MRALSVINALDHAIAEAGKRELNLALDEPEYDHVIPDAKYRQTARKADELRNSLRRLQMPDYHDPLIADAYLLYYHPSHVELAYALVADQARHHPGDQLLRPGKTKLHVIDLAAGNLAMQFGVAIAVALAIERGQRIDEVLITNIDPSQAMLQAGYDAWSEFLDTVSSDPDLRPLQIACDLITSEQMNVPWSLQQQMPDSECWISELYGIHKFNDDNKSCIRDELEYLYEIADPTTVLIACYGERVMTRRGEEWRGEVQDAIDVSPFNHAPFSRAIRWIPRNSAQTSDIRMPWGEGAESFEDILYPQEIDEICHRYGVVQRRNEHVRWRIHATGAISWTRP